MVKVTVDGIKVEVPEDTSVLVAARAAGARIPTLCYHEALRPYGACRLCVCEVGRNENWKLAASCTYPVEDGLEVLTNSEAVKEARRAVIEMLLAASPRSERIRRLASELGVETPRFTLRPELQSDCILCGLCARACAEIVGVAAIDFSNRGVECTVGPPFARSSEVCIGCATCEYVCPTGAIKMVEVSRSETLHQPRGAGDSTECRLCGSHRLEPQPLEIVRPTGER